MIFSRLILATSTALLAASHLAACPVGDDLGRGLIFSFETRDRSGSVEAVATYTRLADDGRIATTFHPQLTGDPWETFKHAGLLDAEAQRRSGRQRAEGTFDTALLDALPPRPNTQISGSAEWARPSQTWSSTYEITTGPMGTTTIGPCTYPAFPLSLVEIRTLPDGTARRFQSDGHYIPELQFFNTPPPRSVAGYANVRTPRFTERFNWPFRGL